MRESWRSQWGFICAATGSAVGLVNVLRFPYLLAENGGASFLFAYLLSLLILGLPLFFTEVYLGYKGGGNPLRTFSKIGGPSWRKAGFLTLGTGIFITAFYSALGAWVFGYLIEALLGNLSFANTGEAREHFQSLQANPLWNIFYQALFVLACGFSLRAGVRSGLERLSRWLMPCMIILLLFFALKVFFLGAAPQVCSFLFSFRSISATTFLLALGHAFFTLSVGQGTMITYGSYLSSERSIPRLCSCVVFGDTLVSILSAFVVFGIFFSLGGAVEESSSQGLGLLFHTLPAFFQQLPGGAFLAFFFFLFISFAALTSEVSVMEPFIAYLSEERGWKRQKAVLCSMSVAFLLGLPCSLAYSSLQGEWMGKNILQWADHFATSFLLPLGALLVVCLFRRFFQQHSADFFPHRSKAWRSVTSFVICSVAPLALLMIFVGGLL